MNFYTDYPIVELGDKEFIEAPIRKCKILSYDDNKYLYIEVEGVEKEMKRGYVYNKKGRCGEVENVSNSEIQNALANER